MLFLNVCCLLQTLQLPAARESVHWKEPVSHEQPPAGTVTRGPAIVFSLSPPLPPPPHAHAPRRKALEHLLFLPTLFLLAQKVPSEAQDRRTPDSVDTESQTRAAPGAHGAACPGGSSPARPPSVPGVVRKPALHSTVRTSISRRTDSPGKTTLNCDASELSTPSPLHIPVCDGPRVFNVVFVSEVHVVLHWLFPRVNSQARRVFEAMREWMDVGTNGKGR